MEEVRDRRLGEVYTPKQVSVMMKRLADKVLGEGFEDRCVVWDNCWGTGNLTEVLNDSKSIYCSTLRKEDIEENKDKNKNACKFVYDFLNEDVARVMNMQEFISNKGGLPKELEDELDNPSGKEIVYYINPPYASTGVFGAMNTDTKEGATDNKVKDVMKKEKYGSAKDQLYTQFIYRIIKMTQMYRNKKVKIVMIVPPAFICTNTYEKFRGLMLDYFNYLDGYIMRADEFSKELSARWGISILAWEYGECKDRNNFKVKIIESNETGEMVEVGEKILYNIDNMDEANDIMKESRDNNRVVAPMTVSSGCRISNKKNVKWERDSLGYIFYKGNNVYHSYAEVGLMTVPYSDGSGEGITMRNMKEALTLFVARRAFGVYNRDWVSDKDEYIYPNRNSEAYKILENNSVLFSLFNDNTHLASFIGEDRNGEKIEVRNKFHFLNEVETKNMYKNSGVEVPNCIYISDVNKMIIEEVNRDDVLDSGKEMLACAKRMFIDEYYLREKYEREVSKEYQMCRWDAGWYQVKWAYKEFEKEKYREFRDLYIKYANELGEYVYESGFLKNRTVWYSKK